MPVTGSKSYRPLCLSIRIYAGGFSFFVCDQQSNTLVCGEHFQLKDNELLADRLLLELGRPDYSNRQIDLAYVLVCGPTTHVPLEEFRRDEAVALYDFVLGRGGNTSDRRVAYTILPQLETVELFTLPRDVEDVVLQYYPTARFFASRSMLMERLLHVEENADDACRRLYLCAEADGYSLLAFDQMRLQFANTFEIASVADALYFVLNVFQTLGLDAEADHLVFVAPSAERDRQLQTQLAEYILHVDSLTPADLFPHVRLAAEPQMPVDLAALLLNRL